MKLNKIFASHMVLAANKPIRIYGTGVGRAELEFAGIKKVIESHGEQWLVEFPPMEYGGPYSMLFVHGEDMCTLEDIYIGEVFLFSGQSNMQFKMEESNTPPDMYRPNDKLRIYSLENIQQTDKYTSDDGWVCCKDKKIIEKISALAYLAGNELSEDKQIAVGIIAAYQGASTIESWVPEFAFSKIGIDIPDSKKHPEHTSLEYSKWNGEGVNYLYIISKIIPFALSQVIWYQGESDTSVDEGLVYCDELCELIKIWRNDFLDEFLPFVIVQIADYIPSAGKAWTLIQEAQLEAQTRLNNITTVISRDVCESDDIHPKTKHLLAHRIAQALKKHID